jgi:hypothetical protein
MLSDDQGNVDTLNRKYAYHYFYSNGILTKGDSFLNTDGYYVISKIKGIPNHTYRLLIKYKEKEYEASAYMLETPVIDSLYFGKIHDPVKGQDYYPPLISFKKSLISNYYLFLFNSGVSYLNNSTVTYDISGLSLDMTLFDGTNLFSYIHGLDVCKGYSSDYWLNGYTWLQPGQTVQIVMYGLSQEGYKFYEALSKQIEQSDGVFNPAPSTPRGNISGGALGYFAASTVSRISGMIPQQ